MSTSVSAEPPAVDGEHDIRVSSTHSVGSRTSVSSTAPDGADFRNGQDSGQYPKGDEGRMPPVQTPAATVDPLTPTKPQIPAALDSDDVCGHDCSAIDSVKETAQSQGTDSKSYNPGRHSVPINNGSRPSLDDAAEMNEDDQDYSSAPTRTLTGWVAVEKTLTDYDKQEIAGYKEDIDSLLTFTGLYSAVLTAFVIVSYTQLQEDVPTESLKVLRIIANQTAGGATLDGPMANSNASALTDSTPFQPSITAIRVNVLWFASLIISLSTASFAILVKQWLRAYMAFTSTSPQSQMRIRHLRRSGLDAWRVLGIASMLPLLLQLSLVLFFVGLCFFTSDIHPSIGNTTLPLVCAWAFLFIAVTLSPIFSSRCPFKTPGLTPITTALRTHIYVPYFMSWVHPGRIIFALLCIAYSPFALLVCLQPIRVVQNALPELSTPKWVKTMADVPGVIGRFLIEGFHRCRLSECWEEYEVARESSQDLIILASADTLQANPELDSTTIEATLSHITKTHWSQAIELLVRLIGNRVWLPDDFLEKPEGMMIEFRPLSERTQAAIKRVYFKHVNPWLPQDSVAEQISDHWQAAVWTVSVFFSIHGYGPWRSDSPPSQAASWAFIRQWLVVQCHGQTDHVSMLQLLLWACSYIARTTDVYHTDEEDLRQDIDVLKQVLILARTAKKSEELYRRSPAIMLLRRLALCAVRRLMGSADNLRSLRVNSNSPRFQEVYNDAVLLALEMCGVLCIAGHSIDCMELLGGRMKEVVESSPQHTDVITTLMGLPSMYLRRHIFPLCKAISGGNECDLSVVDAINEIGKITTTRSLPVTQILNLGLVSLTLERLWRQTTAQRAQDTFPAERVPDTRLQVYNFLASALASKRSKTLYRESSARLSDSELSIVDTCCRNVAAMYSYTSNANSGSALRGFAIQDSPYLAYFLVELASLLRDGDFFAFSDIEKAVLGSLKMMSREEKRRIRREGERAIGTEPSSSMSQRVLWSIQDVIYRSRQPNVVV